jgi:hypothetical protein
MRSPALWVSTLSLVLMGCPEMHRPGGLIDKAAHRDALESIPKRCTAKERHEFCGNGKEDSSECIRRCGE